MQVIVYKYLLGEERIGLQ